MNEEVIEEKTESVEKPPAQVLSTEGIKSGEDFTRNAGAPTDERLLTLQKLYEENPKLIKDYQKTQRRILEKTLQMRRRAPTNVKKREALRAQIDRLHKKQKRLEIEIFGE